MEQKEENELERDKKQENKKRIVVRELEREKKNFFNFMHILRKFLIFIFKSLKSFTSLMKW